MKISVVIAMYNAELVILDCLEALSKQDHLPDEVIVVDNNSTDSSRKVVEGAMKPGGNLKIVLCSESKRGPGAARNKGVSISKGEIIAFTDTDCIPHPSWVKNILLAFDHDPDLDAIGGLHKFFPEAYKNEKPSAMEKFLTVFWLSDCLPRAVISRKEDFFANKFIVTFNCAFKKFFFEKLNGFDESFRTGEDVDITFRTLEAAGKIIAWDPGIMVYHKQNITFKDYFKKIFSYGEGMCHIVRVHFRHQIIIRIQNRYFKWENKIGPSILLMNSFTKMLFLLTAFIIAGYISLFFCGAVFLLLLSYCMIKIREKIKRVGLDLSIKENMLIFIFYLGREIAEPAGRLFWSFKYKVICM